MASLSCTCRTAAAVIASAVLASLPGGVHAKDDIGTAIGEGNFGANIRARYEHVDQDGVTKNADAATTRVRVNYRTGQWRALSAFVEFDHVFHLLRDFNSGGGTSPGKSAYPVVADPKGSDLNQLYLDVKVSETTSARAGRQRILLDNQRFVGGVGWRQNEQTYDGLTVTSEALPKTHLHYSYIGQVRRIFGERVPAGRNNVDVHLLNARIGLSEAWTVTPYYYYIDNQDIAAFSTSTIGARLSGKLKTGVGNVSLVAELARQSDAANNPVGYDADYIHLSGNWSLDNGLSLGIAWESLGGDSSTPGKMFRTPLATLHAFQGWADRFLTTPAAGIDDVFATVRYKAGKWSLTGIYHDFSAESGGGDYGREIDLSAGTKFADRYGVLFKAAMFSGDNGLPDTNKFWIMFTAEY